MAEFTNVTSQNVAANANVLFGTTAVPCPCGKVVHRDGSGNFTVKGKNKYIVIFSANISSTSADGTVELSITDNGEAIPGARMMATSSAANALNNVSAAVELPVTTCCCHTISIKNTGTTAVAVQDANIIIKGDS